MKQDILNLNNNSEIQQFICHKKFLDFVNKESSDEEILVLRESLVQAFRNESINYMNSILYNLYSKLDSMGLSDINMYTVNSSSIDIYNIENYFSFRIGYITGATIPYLVNELTEKLIRLLFVNTESFKAIKNDLSGIRNMINKLFFDFFLCMINRIDTFYGPAGISGRVVPIKLLDE